MAAPETQFQQPGLQASGYTPVETRLNPPIQLPGTGELWAQVGRTAMSAAAQAGEMLQKSPLNPEVRAQMKYGVDQYKAAQDQIAYMKSLGPMGHMLQQTTPQGLTQTAPAAISDPTMAARFMEQAGVGPKTGGTTGPAPDVNAPPQPTKAEGAPPGTFLNPATGNYEPLQQGQPSGQPAPEVQKGPPTAEEMGKGQAGVSMFSSPVAQAAPAPTAFQGPTQEQTTAAVQEGLQRNRFAGAGQGVPANYQSPQDQAALAQWQAQNAHPVMSSHDALAWMKSQTTLAQDATYLPHGGPNQEPAYAFHMKGGGINTVPISQMVRNGAGPVVAAQNTSAVLSSTSDKVAGQQQPGAPPAAAQASPVWNPQQPAPGPTAAPTAPAPVAPAAPGMTDIYGNPLSAYTNVASKGGLTPDQLTAQTTGAGQPAQPAQQPGQPLHALADSTLTPADQDAIQAQAQQMAAPSGEYTGDRRMKDTKGPYTYYINDDPNSPSRGRAYTVLPGSAGGYYNQKRWYLGTNQYEEYELPDSAMRKNMWEKWGANGQLSRGEIDKMSPEEMKPWLQRAWQNENYTRSSPTTGINNDLDATEKLRNYLKKISDLEQTLANSGYPALSSMDKIKAAGKNAAVSLGVPHGVDLGPAHLAMPAGTMDAVTAGGIRELDQTLGQTQDLLKTHPELLLSPGEGGGQETPNLHIGEWVRMGLPNIPASSLINDSAWSGQNIATRARMLDGLRQVTDVRYKDLIDQAHGQWMKISDKHDANAIKIDQKKDFIDPSNRFKEHLFTIDPSDYPEFAREHPRTKFLGTDGKPRQTP